MLRALGKPVPKRFPSRKRTWVFPWALEKKYERLIQDHLRKLFVVLDLSRYDEWLASVHGDAESYATGAARNLGALRDAQKELFDGMEGENFYGGIFSIGEQVSAFNMTQWSGFLSGMLGTEFYPMDYPGVAETLRSWADENFELIRSLSDTYIGRVNQIVSKAVREGTLYRDVIAEIRKLETNLTHARAKLIARDQIGKLNGDLARARQMDAGVEQYIWQTAGDERVRGNPLGTNPTAIPSHWVMDGLTCRWDDPSVYMVAGAWVPRQGKMSRTHPSREIQCRCVGIPRMEHLWQDALTQPE